MKRILVGKNVSFEGLVIKRTSPPEPERKKGVVKKRNKYVFRYQGGLTGRVHRSFDTLEEANAFSDNFYKGLS